MTVNKLQLSEHIALRKGDYLGNDRYGQFWKITELYDKIEIDRPIGYAMQERFLRDNTKAPTSGIYWMISRSVNIHEKRLTCEGLEVKPYSEFEYKLLRATDHDGNY